MDLIAAKITAGKATAKVVNEIMTDDNKLIDETTKIAIHQLTQIAQLQEDARYAEYVLGINRDAVKLYCQQFAYAPEMNYACAEVLSCKDRNLAYRVKKSSFSGYD